MSLYSTPNYNQEQNKGDLTKSVKQINKLITFIFIYLGVVQLISWLEYAARLAFKAKSIPGFFDTFSWPRFIISFIFTIFYAWLMWNAKNRKSNRVIYLAIIISVLDLFVMFIFQFFSDIIYSDNAKLQFEILQWLNAIVGGRGWPLECITRPLFWINSIGNNFYKTMRIFNWLQQIFPIAFFCFALLKQPKSSITHPVAP